MVDLAETLATVLDQPFAMLRITAPAQLPWREPVIIVAFATVNFIRIFAYIPQIVKAAKGQTGVAAISSATRGLFLASHLTTIFYAIFVLSNAVMAIVFLGNAFACSVIVAVTVLRRCTTSPPQPDFL